MNSKLLWASAALILGALVGVILYWVLIQGPPKSPSEPTLSSVAESDAQGTGQQEREGAAGDHEKPAVAESGPAKPPEISREVEAEERVYSLVRLEVTVQVPAGHKPAGPVEVVLTPARMIASPGPHTPATLHQTCKLQERESDALGQVFIAEFPRVPPAAYRILARAPELETVFAETVLPPTAGLYRCVLALRPKVSLSGVLYVGEHLEGVATYTPLRLRRVTRTVEGELPTLEACSDAQGAFSFKGVISGPYDLLVGPPHRELIPAVRIDLGEPQTVQNVHGLPPVGEATISVVDFDNVPMAGVRVTLAPKHQNARSGGSGTTDEEGLVHLGGLLPGKYSILAQKQGYDNFISTYEHLATGPIPQPYKLILRER